MTNQESSIHYSMVKHPTLDQHVAEFHCVTISPDANGRRALGIKTDTEATLAFFYDGTPVLQFAELDFPSLPGSDNRRHLTLRLDAEWKPVEARYSDSRTKNVLAEIQEDGTPRIISAVTAKGKELQPFEHAGPINSVRGAIGEVTDNLQHWRGGEALQHYANVAIAHVKVNQRSELDEHLEAARRQSERDSWYL